MKRNLLIIALSFMVSALFAQDTITGFNFPVNTGADSLNANMGLTQNKGYDLRFQMTLTATTDSTINTIYFDNGASTWAATTDGWQNGSGIKFWSVKFKAQNYANIKVSSKQQSSGDNQGPRDFKLQWKLSGGTWADIDGGTIVVKDDWSTGVVSNLPVPATNTGTTSVYIRWLMNSNVGVNDGTVVPFGYSMIDDILVTGTSTLGTNDILFTNRLSVSPSPNTGNFTVRSTEPMGSIDVLNVNGQVVRHVDNPSMAERFNLTNAPKGMYFLRVKFTDTDALSTSKFIIE